MQDDVVIRYTTTKFTWVDKRYVQKSEYGQEAKRKQYAEQRYAIKFWHKQGKRRL